MPERAANRSGSASAGLLIVGGGMASARLVAQLQRRGYADPVRVACAEPDAHYNRVLLPDLLAGRLGFEALRPPPAGEVRIVAGVRVTDLGLGARHARLADGRRLPWQQLVIATGGRVPLPELPGIELAGVRPLRCRADADALADCAARGRAMVVVGGGSLGIEAAAAARARGATVTLVHRRERLLDRHLDHTAARMLTEHLQRVGIAVCLGQPPVALHGDRQVRAVELADGRRLAADAVLFATGVAPDDELGRRAGLACADGIVVDAQMRTSAPGVHAIGECARAAGGCHASVEPVHRQADVLAAVLCGSPAGFLPPVAAMRLKVPGMALLAVGTVHDSNGMDGLDDIEIRDAARGIYRRLQFHGERLGGAVLVGDLAGSAAIVEAISSGRPSSHEHLAFGCLPRLSGPGPCAPRPGAITPSAPAAA